MALLRFYLYKRFVSCRFRQFMPGRLTLSVVICAIAVMLFHASVSLAADPVTLSCQVPYYLGKPRSEVAPGERVQALFAVENRGAQPWRDQVRIDFPPGWIPVAHEPWRLEEREGRYILITDAELEAGYDQWFDLLTLQIPHIAEPGTCFVGVSAGERQQTVPVQIAAQKGVTPGDAISLEDIMLPLDRDGKLDERVERNTLVLRDRQWDYYKNVLAGKGASNQEVEAVHPLAYAGVDIRNPAGQQKLVVVTIELLDAESRQPAPGLFTPGTTGEDLNAGSMGGHGDKLVAFAAVNGETAQRLLLPVYADERLMNSGQYSLRVSLDDGVAQPLVKEALLTVVKKNAKAATVVGTALLTLVAAMLLSARRIREILAAMQTRWLVTIALFGAAAFAVVNVPSTLLSDFFHIILGPFGFLVSGLFNGICLYMIVVALIVLIPRPGVVAMMTLVRLLLGILAFGHLTPIVLLSYGMHAFLLEALLAAGGVYTGLQAGGAGQNQPLRRIMLVAALCGIADSVASYVSLQAMAFIYRLYYADWYIYLLLAVSGFLYTAIGAACGMILGQRLSSVGGD